MMGRAFLLLLLGAACGFGCHAERTEFCLSDEDCHGEARCIAADGVKACRQPDPLEGGGSGGVGGSGGSEGGGGADGTGGAGGGGGSGEEASEATLELQLRADPELLAFLHGKVRRMGRVALIHATEEGEETLEFALEAPTALPLTASLRIPLPAEQATLAGTVRVEAYRMDATLAPFAEGRVSAELEAGKKAELRIDLSLLPGFDWDRDGDPDATDCAPEDPARHRNVVEICDGVPQGCSPHCILPLPPGEVVEKVVCSAGLRHCAILGRDENEISFVRIHHGDAPFLSTPLEPLPFGSRPADIEWDELNGSLIVVAPNYVLFARTDGSLYPGRMMALQPEKIFASDGRVALVLQVQFDVGFFIPDEVMHAAEPARCFRQDRCYDAPFDSELGIGVTFEKAVLVSASEAIVHVYVIGSKPMPLLGFLVLETEDMHLDYPSAGTIEAIDRSTVPTHILRSGDGIIAFGGESAEDAAAAWIKMADTPGDHPLPEPFALPPGSCPTDFDKRPEEDLLRLSDGCSGSFWELPVDVWGRPTGEGYVEHPLPGCERPISLATLPETDAEPGAVFVACEGESHILVHGRY